MTKTLVSCLLVALLSLGAVAAATEDIAEHPSCKYCGMHRDKFDHSRMYMTFEDGTTVGTCSIHCAAVDLAVNIDKTPTAIQVADYNTKKLTDAEGAYWVIGGSKPGVMTKIPKWAFAEKTDAERFQKEFGGKLATFDEAMKEAYTDMYTDTKMIREKRKMMRKKAMEHK